MESCCHSTELSAVNEALKIFRAKIGKVTEKHHYQNEVLLLRFAFTGESKFKLDFAEIKLKQPFLFNHVLCFEIRQIKRNIPFKDRKHRCRAMVLKRQAKSIPFI